MSDPRFNRISELFRHAIELDARERAAYLRAEALDDVSLADEVERLISAAEQPDDLIDTGPGVELAARLQEPLGLEGRLVGSYRVLEHIATGGMGTVYLAEQDHPKRSVALKVLHAVRPDDEIRRRFAREAEILGTLHHPNIAQVYEAGTYRIDSGASMPFMAMELIHGQPLLDFADESALDLPERIRLMRRVCEAVDHAHVHGIVHRDLKPSNVLVEESGQPKVLDFGVAQVTGPDVDAGTNSTSAGVLLGTIGYMSPEQARGDRDRVDRRTDVHALGAILFELLAGRPAYDVRGRPIHDAIRVVGDEEPTTLASVDRSFRGDLDTIVGRAMEKQPSRRYSSVAELSADLERYLARQPILARRPSTLYRVKRFTQRNRVFVGAVATVLLVALGFLQRMSTDLRHTRALALASAAEQVLLQDPSLSLLLAREAALLERGSLTQSALHRVLGQHNERAILRHDDVVNASCASSTGHVLTASEDGAARVWDSQGELLQTLPHDGAVLACAYSPDGRTLATGGRDGVLKLWDSSGGLLAEVQAHTGPIHNVGFAPRGDTTVLTGSSDGHARLWDVNGRVICQYDLGAPIGVATFSPEGDHVLAASGTTVTGASTGTSPMRIWRRSGELHAELRGHTDHIHAAEFSPEGDRIISASGDRTARLWDLDGNLLQTLEHDVVLWDAAFQPVDGTNRVLTAGRDGVVRVWGLDGQIRNTVHAHGSAVLAIDVSRDGDRFLTSSWDQKAKLFDADGHLLAEFVGHDAMLQVKSASLTPDGNGVLTHCRDGTARLWDAKNVELPSLVGHVGGVSSAVFSRDRERILTGSADATVQLWSARGDSLRTFRGHSKWINQAVFTSDDRLIASASDDGTSRLWKTDDGTALHVLPGATTSSVRGVAFSPTDEVVATSSANGETRLFDVQTGSEIDSLGQVGGAQYWFGAFSLERPWVVLARGRVAEIWDTETVTLKGEFSGHEARVLDASFSPNSELVVTACGDGLARIWRVEEGVPVEGDVPVECAGHQGEVTGCAFSPDGTQLATSSRDGTARLWDLEGRELAVLRGHTGPLWDVSYSADGARLLTASFDKTVRTWIVDPDELLELATSRLDRLDRDFSAGELARFGELLGR